VLVMTRFELAGPVEQLCGRGPRISGSGSAGDAALFHLEREVLELPATLNLQYRRLARFELTHR
jgi:hypothetical protein